MFILSSEVDGEELLSPDKTGGNYESSGNARLDSLQKQLAVEMKVKQGTENMLAMHNNSRTKDRKLISDTQQMLEDSKMKIEALRMAILREQQQASTPSRENNHSIKGKENTVPGTGLSTLELRVLEVRHHIDIESRVIQGAKNMMKFLQHSGHDKKGLQEVSLWLSKHTVHTRNICKGSTHSTLAQAPRQYSKLRVPSMP